MRRDPSHQDGEENPLDAALGELHGLDDLERRFAALDAHLESGGPDVLAAPVADQDDPFADIAAAIREQQAQLGGSSDVADANAEAAASSDDVSSFDEDSDDDSDSALSAEDETAIEIEQLCQDALDALDADHVDLARDTAMVAVKLDDEHPFPTFVLGLVAEREGDLDTAKDMADLALGTAATNPDAISLRAHIHVRQHEFEDAERLLRFGIAHNPDEAMLHEGLARIALARGRHEEALQAATTALRIEPTNSGALAVRSAALDEGTDRNALLAALRQGVQLHPEDPYSMLELASVEMEHGNVDRARALLMRAQRLAPRDSEIHDVRAMLEHVSERPLLRPVPGLVRWLRDFPGGLAGFLVGFVVAALPLHALAMSQPSYRVAALAIIAAWGSVALYAWIAPSVLTRRLNQRAARAGLERMTTQLEALDVPAPDLERIADTTSMLIAARRRRDAAMLVALAASRTPATDVAEALESLARRLRGPGARIRAFLLAIPGLARMFVAVAAGIAITAPLIGQSTDTTLLVWHAVAMGCLAVAWLLMLADRAETQGIDDAFTAVGLADSVARPFSRRSS
ncbi:MAG: hypothetical protein JWM25_997 [Thermoleophilia bacterium]|nr:hypothetical protein [Thermoleophilia bacterium]